MVNDSNRYKTKAMPNIFDYPLLWNNLTCSLSNIHEKIVISFSI